MRDENLQMADGTEDEGAWVRVCVARTAGPSLLIATILQILFNEPQPLQLHIDGRKSSHTV